MSGMRAEINKTLRWALENPRVVLLGESICDPYGGASKVTRGLSTKHPDRVMDMPISEDAIVGISLGFAMCGFIPIVEIMFFDFMALCVNQLLNVAQKMSQVHEIEYKVIIRTMKAPMEYGPTHSQDLSKLLRAIGVQYYYSRPGVIMRQYEKALSSDDNVIVFIEDKNLY